MTNDDERDTAEEAHNRALLHDVNELPRITITLAPLQPTWYIEHPDWPELRTGREGEDEWLKSAHQYLATLSNGAGSEYVAPFFTGKGWTRTPSAHDVLGSLILECVEPDITFEEWCDEYGENDDSRRALAIFEHAQRETPKLEAFLGPELFTFLREHDETEWPTPMIDTTSTPITHAVNVGNSAGVQSPRFGC